MAETRFTPGPWATKYSEDVTLDTGGENTYSVIFGAELVAVVVVDSAFGKDALHSANQSLIKAAPDLYAALEDLLSAVCEMRGIDLDVIYEGRDGALSKAKTALAKARGETSD